MGTVIRCKVLTIANGSEVWIAFAEENEKVGMLLEKPIVVFFKSKETFEYRGMQFPVIREDRRDNPPFFQILPCPFCGVNEEKAKHDPLKHIAIPKPENQRG